MKIHSLFNELLSWGAAFESYSADGKTCDTLKAGSLDTEITGIGSSMFATPDVVRQCVKEGRNFLIVHEPTYYNHWDDHNGTEIGVLKQKLIEESGITVVRFHDHAHAMQPDLIYDSELKALGLKGRRLDTDNFAIGRFELDEPLTARALAELMEEKLGLKHVRIAGCADKPGRLLSCSFGTPGHTCDELKECDFVLTGEICEWAEGQMARDYAQLGYNKAILVMSHIGSEREGMRLLVDKLAAAHPELDARYIECGEVYGYTD